MQPATPNTSCPPGYHQPTCHITGHRLPGVTLATARVIGITTSPNGGWVVRALDGSAQDSRIAGTLADLQAMVCEFAEARS